MDPPAYTPLDARRREIRLILIHPSPDESAPIECSTSIVSLDEEPSPRYYALSYTWGAPGITKPVTLNGAAIQVTENLSVALHRLRIAQTQTQDASARYHLWIDAICINQADLDERAQQVQLMRDIYTRAARVVVWLGDEGADGRLALRTMHDLCVRFGGLENDVGKAGTLQALNALEGTPEAEAIVAFFARPWWARLWTVQEYVFGKEVKFLCGDVGSPWELFQWWGLIVTAKMDAAEWKYEKTSFLRMIANEGCSALFAKSFIRQQYLLHKKMTLDMASLLDVLSGMLCTNPQDRIFAIQALASDGDSFGVPDYTVPVSDLYCKVAGIMAETEQDLGVLRRGHQDLSTAPDGVVLPSWVPSWGQSAYPRALDHRRFSAGSGRKPLARYYAAPSRALHVQGIFWDTVTAVDPFPIAYSMSMGNYTRVANATKRQGELFDMWREKTACFKDNPAQKPRAIHCYNCHGPSLDHFYHCYICEDGLFDLCVGCVEDGTWCADESHELARRDIINKEGDSEESGKLRQGPSDAKYKILPRETPVWAKLIYEGRGKTYPTGIPQLQAYFRTILFDTDYVAHTRLLSSEERFYDFVKVFGVGLLFQAWFPPCSEIGRWKRNAVFHIGEPLEFGLLLGDPGSEGALTLPSNASVQAVMTESCGLVNLRQFVSSVQHKTIGRQFFVTERGYMGMGPPHVEVGDVICVFPGMKVPMMLRRTEKCYQLQGECYVHGIMDGEVMECLDKGAVSVEEVQIK